MSAADNSQSSDGRNDPTRESAELAYQQGLELHRGQRFAEAAALFERALHADPSHSGAWRMRGLTALQSGDFEAGIHRLNKAAELDPNSASTYCYLGHGLRILARYPESVRCHDRALALNPRLADSWFDRGCALRSLKRSEEALHSFEQALAYRPDFVEALINRANTLADLQRLQEALASIEGAIARTTSHPTAYANRASILMTLNRPADALASYQTAIALGTVDPELHNDRGVALMKLGRTVEAIAAFEGAAARPGDTAAAHHNRGVALSALGRTEEALGAYEQALAQRPAYVEAHAHRAGALLDLNRRDEALAALHAGLVSCPDNLDLLSALGNLLLDLKRFREALQIYDRTDMQTLAAAAAYNNRAVALRGLGRSDDALKDLERALQSRPDNPEILHNQGNVLRDLHRPEDALACYDRALELRPDYAEAHNSRAIALMLLQRLDAASVELDRAVAARPEYADAHWNRGLLALRRGDFARGWEGYEWRKRRAEPVAHRRYGNKLWIGQDDIAGATIFVHWEQGLGDTILFSRYALALQERSAHVVLSVQQPLQRLMEQLSPEIRILGGNDIPESFDRHCPLGSLPLAFGTRAETIPSPAPYLRAPKSTLRAWQDRLGPTRQPRIAVVWRGSSSQANDARPMPLAMWRPLFDLPAEWFALQKHVTPEDAELLRSHGVRSFDDELQDFSVTAALAAQMDLIVSVDTSVAHLAGAMGRPVWVLLPYNADWRWMLKRTDSPWYPTARLFRQQTIADWRPIAADVLNAARTTLASLRG